MDRIYEAYSGGMGDAFAKKTQERIQWICGQVKGEQILDVGCSQGITSILLAREGKQVTGLDVGEDAINYANERLKEEPEEVQKRVKFFQGDFACFDAKEDFDTVIMGEVLEHLLHPEAFLERAYCVLKENGVLIITVPFGINDDPDHKQTFYYWSLRSLIEVHFRIIKTVFFGKWIGFAVKKSSEPTGQFSPTYAECIQVEQEFYKIERNYINLLQDEKSARLLDKDKYETYANQLLEKQKQAEANYLTAKEWLRSKDEKLSRVNEEKILLQNELQQAEEAYQKTIAQLSAEGKSRAEEITHLQEVLGQSDRVLEEEEQFLQEMKAEINSLNAQLKDAQRKVKQIDALLHNTWYGKLALRVFRSLRKIKRYFEK